MKLVLIVDEDTFTRNVFAQTLSQRGFEVHHARSAALALAAIEEHPYDLVVLDSELPDMEGIQLVRTLRAREITSPIVYLSSVFRRQPGIYEELTDELGVSLILHKPISPVEFCAQVENIFDISQETKWFPGLEDIEVIAEAESARLDYRVTIAAKLTELEVMLERLRKRSIGSQMALDFVELLRGTASRYGFFEISRAVGRIEVGINRLENGGGRGRRTAWGDIFDALDEAIVAARVRSVESPLPAAAERWTASVLIVDDDEDFLAQVGAFGRENFVRVVTATSPLQVIDKLRDPTLDALLVDVDLGDDFDTFEFVRRLRERSNANQLPLGFIAEHGSVPDRVMAAHIGASVFVDKPLDSSQFADIVHRMVTIRKRGRPTVVIIDRDDRFVAEIREILVQAGMDAHHIDDTREVVERLDSLDPHGLIVNVSMPGIGGFDLCRMIRAMPRWHELPILLVGDRMDPETRIAAFRSGADDYLSKPPIREELLARLQVRIERLQLLREQASVDMLTGLLTRRPFLQRVNARLSEVRRGDRRLTIGLLDLDGFKAVNDTYGHIAGDRVLAGLGRLLANRFRLEDLRCRWGGEEFMVALVDLVDEEVGTAQLVLQRILDEFAAMVFVGDDGAQFSVTFSAGMAVFPDDGDDFRTLLSVADKRLYSAKEAGRNRIVAS